MTDLNMHDLVKHHQRYMEAILSHTGKFNAMGMLIVRRDTDGHELDSPEFVPIIADDTEQLAAGMRIAAVKCRAFAAVSMLEVWLADVPTDKPLAELKPGYATNNPDRKEALVLTVELGAETQTWFGQIKRSDVGPHVESWVLAKQSHGRFAEILPRVS